MTREPESEKGYLYRSLADGARAFRYRSRLRVLLGLPSDGVAMNFSKPLPMAALPYLVRRFSEEFERLDQPLAGDPRHATHSQETIFPSPRASVAPVQTNRESEPREPKPKSSQPAGTLNRLAATKATDKPAFPVVPLAQATAAELGQPQNRPNQAEAPAEKSGAKNIPHDEVIPGTSPDPLAGTGSRSVEPADRLPSSSSPLILPSVPGSGPFESDLPDPTTAQSPSEGRGPSPLPVQMDGMARRSFSGLTGRTTPPLTVRDLRPRDAGAVESPVRANTSSRPEDWEDVVWSTASSPSAHRPEPRRSRASREFSETSSQPSPGMAFSAAPSVAPAQQQVIVIQQRSDPDPPAAFWERSYLNHLRARIRR